MNQIREQITPTQALRRRKEQIFPQTSAFTSPLYHYEFKQRPLSVSDTDGQFFHPTLHEMYHFFTILFTLTSPIQSLGEQLIQGQK